MFRKEGYRPGQTIFLITRKKVKVNKLLPLTTGNKSITLKDDKTGSGTTLDTYELTGLGENTNAGTRDVYLNGDGTTADKTKPATHWVDEKDPPIEVTYDVLNQRLQFEADMLGNIEDQHPVIIFYYASAIYLQESAKEKDLLYSSSLFEKVYNLGNNHLQSLYNMIAVSFKTKVFKSVKRHTLKAYEKNPNDMRLVEGLARIHFYLGNRNESIKLFRMLYKSEPNKTEGRLPFVSSLNYTSGVSQKEYLEEMIY